MAETHREVEEMTFEEGLEGSGNVDIAWAGNSTLNPYQDTVKSSF